MSEEAEGSTIESHSGEMFTSEDDAVHSDNLLTLETETQRKRHWPIEPAVFAVFVAINLTSTVYQNAVLYQSCIVSFNYDAITCQPLLGVINGGDDNLSSLEDEVQKYASNIFMTRSLLESLVPAFVSLVIGPWSDKFGRRPVLLTVYSGYLISYTVATILAGVAMQGVMTPWLYLLSSVPIIFTGGQCVLSAGIYSYVSDTAEEHTKPRKMVIIEAIIGAGVGVGSVSSGYIYEATNVITIFGIATALMALSLAYVYFFILESLKPEQLTLGVSKIREFFRIDLIKDLIATSSKRRPNHQRTLIWLTMIALVIQNFVQSGENNIVYLFLRKKFEWTASDYSMYNGILIGVQVVGSIAGVTILVKVFKCTSITLCLIAAISNLLRSLIYALASSPWEIYVAVGVCCLNSLYLPMLLAWLSHLLQPTEFGKIFSLTISLEYIFALGAIPLYTAVYNATISYSPGSYNFLSMGLYTACVILIGTEIIFRWVIQKKTPPINE